MITRVVPTGFHSQDPPHRVRSGFPRLAVHVFRLLTTPVPQGILAGVRWAETASPVGHPPSHPADFLVSSACAF